jgi:hypothetical protein
MLQGSTVGHLGHKKEDAMSTLSRFGVAWLTWVVTIGVALASASAEQIRTSFVLIEKIQVRSLVTGEFIEGSKARLKRTRDRLEVDVKTDDLPSGLPVTVLWAVFNNPVACVNGNPVTGSPCGPADLAIEATGATLQLAVIGMADPRGRLKYEDTLHVGDTSRCLPGFPAFCRSGVTNPREAEVHSVVLDSAGNSILGSQFIP